MTALMEKVKKFILALILKAKSGCHTKTQTWSNGVKDRGGLILTDWPYEI